jgi:Fur family ferric uptake transcriptional regulator
MPVAEKYSARKKFTEFLSTKGRRMTAQRRAIIETVFGTAEHFTAEQLLAWSQKRNRSVSRPTVYRTLPLLTECGLVREIDLGKAYRFYDPNYADHPNHSHIICAECGKIIEFESDRIEKLEDEIGQRLGFTVKARRLQLTGSCEEFRKFGTCTKKGA